MKMNKLQLSGNRYEGKAIGPGGPSWEVEELVPLESRKNFSGSWMDS